MSLLISAKSYYGPPGALGGWGFYCYSSGFLSLLISAKSYYGPPGALGGWGG